MASTHRIPPDQRRRRLLGIAAAVVGGIVFLLWPLQTILSALFAGSAWILTLAVGVWIERTVEARDRDQVLTVLPFAAAALVAVASVLTFVWPTTMAGVALLAALTAVAGLGFLAWVERQTRAEGEPSVTADDERDASRHHDPRAA